MSIPGAQRTATATRLLVLACALAATMPGVPLLAASQVPSASPGHQPGQLVVGGFASPSPELDPFRVYGTQTQSFFRLIYEPLFDRDPAGALVAPLLESWWTHGPRTWDLTLRPGSRFHDGSELTAADVAFSLRRIVDPAVASPRRSEFPEIEAIEVVGPRTVRIVTRSPYPLLPERLSQFSMLLPEDLRGQPPAEFFRHPVGLGPFRLESLTPDHAILVPFADYHAGPSRLSRVVFRFISDPGARLEALLDGRIDLLANLLPTQVDRVIRNPQVRLLKQRSIRFMDILLDWSRGPLAHAAVRQALRHATDVDALITYVARGNGQPLATVVLPQDIGFDPTIRSYPFDPARARRRLAESGHAGGFALRGLATPETQALAVAVSRQWAHVGVTLNLTVEDRPAAIASWIRDRARHDLMVADPTSLMFHAAFHLRMRVDPRHPMGRAGHPRVLELLHRADAEPQPGLRRMLLREAQGIVRDEALSIPLYQMVDLYAVRRTVHGFAPSTDTILRLAGVAVTP